MINQRTTGLLVTTFILVSVLVLQACSPNAVSAATPAATTATSIASTAAASPTSGLPTFTAAELAKYDGKNGNPAYVAVNGTVYDVSNVPEWKNGIHQGRFQAGQDLSEAIKQSPHGTSKLDMVPAVGTYIG